KHLKTWRLDGTARLFIEGFGSLLRFGGALLALGLLPALARRLRALLALRLLLLRRLFLLRVFLAHTSTTSPLDLKKRTRRPSSSFLTPTRSPFFVAGLKSATFEMRSGISFSTMPPVTPFIGFGRWCFFTRLAPSPTT